MARAASGGVSSITDAYGRTITIETVGDEAVYTLTDDADLHVVVGFPASHPRDAALETLASMAPPGIAPPPAAVPETVSAMRFRLALKAAGLYDAVKAAMEAENGAAEVMWEYATEFYRHNAELIRMAGQMGAGAMGGFFTARLALAVKPEDAAARILIASDGNETAGSLIRMGKIATPVTLKTFLPADTDIGHGAAAADPPARPVPTTRMVYLRLLAGFTNFISNLCRSHFSWRGPAGILESSVISQF